MERRSREDAAVGVIWSIGAGRYVRRSVSSEGKAGDFEGEREEMEDEEEEFDLQELIGDVVRDANFEAQAQGRQVVWEERAPAFIRGRPARQRSRYRLSFQQSIR